jgi:hypothetical protein
MLSVSSFSLGVLSEPPTLFLWLGFRATLGSPSGPANAFVTNEWYASFEDCHLEEAEGKHKLKPETRKS